MKSTLLLFIYTTLILFFNYPSLFAENKAVEIPDTFKIEFSQQTTELNPLEVDTVKFDGIIIPNRLFIGDEVYFKDYIPEIISEYFLLGTMYGNRKMDVGVKPEKDFLDYYSYHEDLREDLVIYLKNYIRQEFNVLTSIERDDKKERINLYSKEMVKKMNRYLKSKNGLDISIFNSQEKIYSFLFGVFFRKGYYFDSSVYCIFNPYDNDLIYSLLRQAECSKIVYLHTKDRIPGSMVLYFEPSIRLRKYFEILEDTTFSYLLEDDQWVKPSTIINKKIKRTNRRGAAIKKLFMESNE